MAGRVCAGFLVAFLVAAPLWAGPLNGGYEDKHVTFLGFSQDETRAAWLLRISRHDVDGFVDHYRLVRVVDTETNLRVAEFRNSPIIRTDRRGKRVHAHPEKVARANSPWDHAQEQEQWRTLQRRAQFKADVLVARRLPLDISPDPNLVMHTDSEGRALVLTSPRGQSLGYTLRLVDGDEILLGRFRHEAASREKIRARLTLRSSKSGRRVAVLNQFEISSPDGPRSVFYGKTVQIESDRGVQPQDFPLLANHDQTPDYYRHLNLRLAEQLDRNARFFP